MGRRDAPELAGLARICCAAAVTFIPASPPCAQPCSGLLPSFLILMRAALPSLSRAVGGVRMARGLTTSRPAMVRVHSRGRGCSVRASPCRRQAAGASAEPIKTPLHDVHVELGGKVSCALLTRLA